MIDSHAHLDNFTYEEIELFLHDLSFILSPSTTFTSIDKNLAIKSKFGQKILIGLGIHPEDTDEFCMDFENNIKKLHEIFKIHKNQFSIIGECGLDYYHKTNNISDQKMIFIEQIKIAKNNNLPLVLHSRNNKDKNYQSCIFDSLNLLGNEKYFKGVMHCFTGSIDEAEAILECGLFIGFTNILTYGNPKKHKDNIIDIPNSRDPSANDLFETFKVISKKYPDKILLETDSPYLPPKHKRGHRCLPSDVKFVYEFVKDYISEEQIENNFIQFLSC